MALITAHFNAVVILVCSDRYAISLSPYLRTPSQSLISLAVSVEVKHHVYLNRHQEAKGR